MSIYLARFSWHWSIVIARSRRLQPEFSPRATWQSDTIDTRRLPQAGVYTEQSECVPQNNF